MRLRGGGSSPRVRGKRAPGALQGRSVRLIPARAGKTRLRAGEAVRLPAHPRACGENRNFPEYRPKRLGSSPRVRGKPRRRPRKRVPPRLIPARAGKTRPGTCATLRRAAHPRACGENPVPAIATEVAAGSSPRVRGKPGADRAALGRGRLIPARAGKTSRQLSRHTNGRAHPRACGENVFWATSALLCLGSSPRVRGKLQELDPGRARRGLIPACAGKTTGGGGTPPPGGLIPACAGKTQVPDCAVAGEGAHPRACGENSTRSRHPARASGSSPRVRGKLVLEARG